MAMSDAQAKANADCRTIYYCVDCMDKNSGAQICKPITANPVCPNAGQVVAPVIKTVSGTSASITDDAVPVPADPFEVIIAQSVCYKSGVTIEPYVTGAESAGAMDRMASAKARQAGYSFSWAVDGKKMGESARLECVCGKEAVLTATELATKKVVTKTIKLPATCSGTGSSARVPAPTGGGLNEGEIVVAYKKTSCFGTCPVYEVKFYSNGTASWDGFMNVERMGHFETKLGPDVLGRIQERAFALKYFDFASKYPTSFTVADAPSTITYVKLGSKEKQVESIMDAPQKLTEFENMLYDEIVKLGWKADPPKKAPAVIKATGSAIDPKH